MWPLRGINKTALGAKLIVVAGLAYLVSFNCQSRSPTDGIALLFVRECTYVLARLQVRLVNSIIFFFAPCIALIS